MEVDTKYDTKGIFYFIMYVNKYTIIKLIILNIMSYTITETPGFNSKRLGNKQCISYCIAKGKVKSLSNYYKGSGMCVKTFKIKYIICSIITNIVRISYKNTVLPKK